MNGADANEARPAFSSLQKARGAGLVPTMNFMKTYAITPKEFGQLAAEAADAGAEIVYVVDSTGSMMPDMVKAFFTEAREKTDVKLGSHSHDNLKLAVANSLTASFDLASKRKGIPLELDEVYFTKGDGSQDVWLNPDYTTKGF